MIDLHTWTTPNGRKISIMLEELGLPYRVVPVDIGQDAQFAPEFLKIAPNNKIPAIVDHDAETGRVSVFESGAILVYLAEKTGKLLSPSGPARVRALEWLFWQVGGLGPMLGQLNYFANRAKERVPHATDRFRDEANRLLGVLDRRLGEAEYLAGADYSIADIACYPWTVLIRDRLGTSLGDHDDFAHVERWLDRVGRRDAVVRGMDVPKSDA